MSETIILNGMEAINAAFDDFLDTDVADVEMNPVLAAGTYLFTFAEYTRETDADKLYKSVLSEKMIAQAVSRGQEPKALGLVRFHMRIEDVVSAPGVEEPDKLKGKMHIEEIAVGERTLGQVLKLAAAILDKTPKELKDAVAGTKLPDLVDTFAGQQIVATIKHRPRRDDPELMNVELDFSSKGVLCSLEAYNRMQAA